MELEHFPLNRSGITTFCFSNKYIVRVYKWNTKHINAVLSRVVDNLRDLVLLENCYISTLNVIFSRILFLGKVQESRLSLKDDLIDGEHRDVFVLENRISSLQNTKANIAKDAPDSDTTFSCETESPIVDARISQGSNESFLKAGGRQLTSYFIPKDINSSIISSENTRVFCSIMIALLVVVSYANLPRHIVRSKSTIASRPLYVLLVTDLMIVGLRLYFTKQSLTKTAVEKPESSQGDGSNWDEAVKFLEWGLVVYQTLRAIFIDCSFYTVVVVCGFSLI